MIENELIGSHEILIEPLIDLDLLFSQVKIGDILTSVNIKALGPDFNQKIVVDELVSLIDHLYSKNIINSTSELYKLILIEERSRQDLFPEFLRQISKMKNIDAVIAKAFLNRSDLPRHKSKSVDLIITRAISTKNYRRLYLETNLGGDRSEILIKLNLVEKKVIMCNL